MIYALLYLAAGMILTIYTFYDEYKTFKLHYPREKWNVFDVTLSDFLLVLMILIFWPFEVGFRVNEYITKRRQNGR